MPQKPFIPHELPPSTLDWARLAPLVSKAMLDLARFDGTLRGVVNPAVLLSPITNREAVLSSQIEGTQATIAEVLQHEAGEQYDEHKRGEIREILNYRRALLTGEDYVQERPITLQLIRELHAMLMTDVRGGDKTPGQFRTDQNWIGKKGSTIEQARFVPPDPVLMNDHLHLLQTFLDRNDLEPLVQLSVAHAQFEILHPFSDGNGRLGRMLIPLFLFQKGILQRPVFYLSEYLEAHDAQYRDGLLAITEAGDWQGWIEFFLEAIAAQARDNNTRAQGILALYDGLKPRFATITRSQYAQSALDAFFRMPIINSSDFMALTGVTSRATANGILKALHAEEEITLLRAGTGRAPSIYALTRLLDISEGRNLTETPS